MSHEDIKKRVYAATLGLYHAGLIRLSVGNISARIDEHLVAITPAGRSYDILNAEDIAIVSLDGNLVEGDFKPSSETPLHTAIYRELLEVGAAVHTHSIYAMTFAASENKFTSWGGSPGSPFQGSNTCGTIRGSGFIPFWRGCDGSF